MLSSIRLGTPGLDNGVVMKLTSDRIRDTSPGDPGSPTVVFDKKTKRRFLDLGVTLRRSYIRVRKDKSSRLSESALSEDFSPPADSCRSSHPYQTLSSDEPAEDTSCPASSWTRQQVCDWLRGIHMEQYVPEFNAGDIDGEQLLQMDSNKLKDLGVFSSSHRSALKRRIKDLLSAAEKEKKALRQKEKQRRRDNETHRN
ncbi:Sterile alpha motif domain containing protein 14 [Dissostichus eleginoides]|uniref:Sterile alpha motif domain containing protein 14 n=1 Tax=Dissostichus eleginoides TaxID=100907 RepID=A0AAD9B2W5_DISEL|nr:Sterile alpha motif domain containing protein 14 [Dissostichus eleginoides]